MHTSKEFEYRLGRAGWRSRLAFLILAGLAALPLDASTIHLRCFIRDGYLTGDYGTEIPRIQRELCQKLKQRLDGKALLLAWDYVVADSSKASKPALVLTLSNDGQHREMALQLERQNYPIDPWTRVWKEPGDTLVDPLAGKAAEFFAGKVDKLILTALEETISNHLKGIPIATASWSPEGPPKVVTTLPWQGNEALRASKFRLHCQRSNQSVVEFESHVLQPDKGTFSLEAMFRLPDEKKVREILPEAKQVKPRLLFLLQFQLPNDTDTY